jgi:mycothiol synthase
VEDIELAAKATNLSRRELEHERDVTTDELRVDVFEDESFDPKGSWLALLGDEPVGFAWAVVDKERLKMGMTHGHACIEVVPEHRDGRIERELMSRCLDYLRGRGMRMAQLRAPTEIGWTNDLAREFGFHEVRRFFRMAYSKASPPEAPVIPDGLQITHVPFNNASDGEIKEFSDMMNEAFVDHFDYAPMPASRFIRYRDVAVDVGLEALIRKDGKIIAASFNEDAVLYNKEHGTKIGWVWVLGVDKNYRRAGLGTAMLIDGIRWLFSRGLDTALLYVDAENRRALGLYTSIGFEVVNESVIYRVDL